MKEIIEAFFIGGGVIAGSKVAAKFLGPSLAPLVGGMPTGIIASFFLNNNSDKISFFHGYVYSSILLFLAILLIHVVSVKYPKVNVNYISVSSLIMWFVFSYFLIKFTTHKKLS